MSAPSRGGGSEERWQGRGEERQRVVSFTGAWIENCVMTAMPSSACSRLLHGGVDRNKLFGDSVMMAHESPPSRGRGSKLIILQQIHIEQQSPPSRGRGSKLEDMGHHDPAGLSPPSRGRGSKPRSLAVWLRDNPVASFTGAWIETLRPKWP